MSDPKTPVGNASVGPRYYEVWGQAIVSAEVWQKTCWLLLIVLMGETIVLNRVLRRPPVVIRVDAIGNATPVKEFGVNNRVTQPEVLEFVRLLLRNLLERNHLTWKTNLLEADRMVTPKLRDELNSRIDFKEETSAIENKRLLSTLELSEVKVMRETPEAVLVSVKGYRRIKSSMDESFLKETVFSAEVGLKKVSRTIESPFGLAADSYRQEDFKNE